MNTEYEQLGAFYLGALVDPETNERTEVPLLYDSKDLTTHAVCLGMTGSGKTGLCVCLLEEAAMDSIPAIVLDLKGDLANMLLQFPNLAPSDFEPWIPPGVAEQKGTSRAIVAEKTAALWKTGLADWGQDGGRIARLRETCDVTLYTPGSSSIRPLSILKSFAAPADAVLNDDDAFRERIISATVGLLTMLEIESDPLSSEYTLLSSIFDHAWRAGQDLELTTLIQHINEPPFEKIGAFAVEQVFPAKGRFKFALALNNLIASPAFSAWTAGEPLDVKRLLWSSTGKPQLAILSLAHLTESERMFFVTLLLNEVIAWMRSQPGTSSLRALLYMDEIFGYFPPTANPPSKRPLLTLMKQARAYGLGLVLATQNPVDLDYKGLSNAGTWFLGRLQTERDKLRVVDGLDSVAKSAGSALDKKEIERRLSGLGKRVFLLNNVHEPGPSLFHTRWAMSYLRGPMTRNELLAFKRDAPIAGKPDSGSPVASTGSREKVKAKHSAPGVEQSIRPTIPSGIGESFLRRQGSAYCPHLYFSIRLHYANTRYKVDTWRLIEIAYPLVDDEPEWGEQLVLEEDPNTRNEPDDNVSFSDIPAAALVSKNYTRWKREVRSHVHRTEAMALFRAPSLKLYSSPDESEADFRQRARHLAREHRDEAIAKMREKYRKRIAAVERRVEAAQDKVEREEAQYSSQKLQSVVSIGSTLLGAFFGKRTLSTSKISTGARGLGRAAQERSDVVRAKERLEGLQEDLDLLEEEMEVSIEEIRFQHEQELVVEEAPLNPRKGDITVEKSSLMWVPV